jgi:PAS domain S-box-containing protein
MSGCGSDFLGLQAISAVHTSLRPEPARFYCLVNRLPPCYQMLRLFTVGRLIATHKDRVNSWSGKTGSYSGVGIHAMGFQSSRERKRREHQGGVRKPPSNFREKIAVAELAHELAHELNNPLEALTNLLYLAKDTAAGNDQLKGMLNEAESQVARIATVVQSILALEEGDHDQRLRTAGKLLDATAFQQFKQEYESALHLASIVESAQDAIYSKKLDGTIMAWNAEAERLFGYSSSDVLGKSVRMLIPPDKSQEERQILEKVRSGERVQHFETLRSTKQGKVIRVSVSMSAIRNPSGRLVGVSTIAREVQS